MRLFFCPHFSAFFYQNDDRRTVFLLAKCRNSRPLYALTVQFPGIPPTATHQDLSNNLHYE